MILQSHPVEDGFRDVVLTINFNKHELHIFMYHVVSPKSMAARLAAIVP
jgi:hypothetical protein